MNSSESAFFSGPEDTAGPTLKETFRDDFYIGAALNVDQICGREPAVMALVARQFNSITPENIMKWEEIHPEPGRYDFDATDRYVAFGEQHRMHIVAHALVWFHQTPDWVFQDEAGNPVSREALLERMREHIHTVVGRYRGRIHGWDVVNEAVMKDGTYRRCKWLEIIGEDYVQKAFEFAREADPDAELYYNEYDYEFAPKAEATVRLVEKLQKNGVRVDGLGIQGHWFVAYPSMAVVEGYVERLRSLGVKLMITEMDIGVLPYYPVDSAIVPLSSFDAETQKRYNPYPDDLPPAAQEEQAKRYVEFFSFFRKHRDLIGRVTFWGVHDGQSWRSYWPITGRTEHPLLFDRKYQPKAAFHAVVRLSDESR